MTTSQTDKGCCRCGGDGHRSNTCKWPIYPDPPMPVIPDPEPEEVPDIENWYDLYGGY